MPSVKKGRDPIFSHDELKLLENLIFKYKYILENKKKDAISVVQKKSCWEKLTIEFNARRLNISVSVK